jgi:BirA family transcriptional regulator, biotin operon repressor / biotin---[acetyl-CoA-carboxylase] ligase
MGFALGPVAARAGYQLESFDSIGSTNDPALARARSGEDGPMWFVTGHQTSGRGRRGRAWEGPPGNLAASLFLATDASVDQAVTLGFVAGLSLHDALSTLDLGNADIRLKWPNDVLANGGKLTGILLESESTGEGRTAIVVGIGVNIVSAPEGATFKAACLAGLGASVTAEQVFSALSDAWCARYAQWDAGRRTRGGIEAIRTAWIERAAGIGGPVAIVSGAREIRGTFETLDADGRLVVLTADGSRVAISAGDVYFGDAASASAAG